MHVQFLEEGHKKKFAVIPYAEFLRLVRRAADTEDYRRAVAILNDDGDEILDYDSRVVLENPVARERYRAGISQRELATRLGVDPSYLSRLERPGARIGDAMIRKIARALKCSEEDMLI